MTLLISYLTRGSLASLGTHSESLYKSSSANYEISIYIIISSTPHGSLALLGSLSAPDFYAHILMVRSSKKSFCRGLCSERNTFLRAAGVRLVRSGFFFHELNFFTNTFKLFYWSEALKSRFNVANVKTVTCFRALRARGAR